jgi:glutathione synthase/RimK-type ligase-like ATP-grasp enzyme
MRLGIVTCDKCPTLIPGEKPLIPLLHMAGIEATPVIWNDPTVDWSAYDALLVRSIWDYHLHADDFQAWLSRLDQSKIPVWNPVDVLRWNHHKFYLRELEQRGVAIAPTLFFRRGDTTVLERVLAAGWRKVVIKPAVSASGYRTHAFRADTTEAKWHIEEASAHGDFLIQPFLAGIRDSGEVSMIFFNGKYSHAVLKKPRAGEFRVQAEHGGHEVAYSPAAEIIRAGETILGKTGMPLLYARVDGLVEGGQFVLMELELIEPDLFLDNAHGSINRLAEELVNRIRPSASS